MFVTVLSTSESGVITGVLALSSTCQRAGLTREELIGTDVSGLALNERQRERFFSNFGRCLFTRVDQEFDVRVSLHGHEETWQVTFVRAESSPPIVLVMAHAIRDGEPLSSEEIRLVRLLAQDVTFRHIARVCRISPNTVHRRLAAIRHKLSVQTVHGIVEAAHVRGIL